MKSYSRMLTILVFAAMGCFSVLGCDGEEPESIFVPVSSISKNGFAISRERMKTLHGREIKVHGFVDYSNVFIDSRDGRGVHLEEWRFNLKGSPDAEAGESFAVRVMKDDGRDKALTVIEQNKLAGKPTKIYVVGKVFTFDAPTSISQLTGLYLTVKSSTDISFENAESDAQAALRTNR